MNGVSCGSQRFRELNQALQILANWSSDWRSPRQQLVKSFRFSSVAIGSEQGTSSSVIRSLSYSFYVRLQHVLTGDGTAKLYRFPTVRPPSLHFPLQKAIEGGCLRRGRHQYVISVLDSSSCVTQPPSEPSYYPNDGWTRSSRFIVDGCRLRLAPSTTNDGDSPNLFHSQSPSSRSPCHPDKSRVARRQLPHDGNHHSKHF